MPISFQPRERPLKGIALSAMAYGLFSLQDAIVKWLVESLAVPQVLFFRSLVIVAIALVLTGREGPRQLLRGPNKGALLLRAVLILLAWMLYYSAARHLGLAELTTIYFVAPILVVGLSVLILKERVDAMRWAIVSLGFAGAVLAALPGAPVSLTPAILALLAAFCWGLSSILLRMVSRTESTANQMLASNLLFLLACGAALPWVWETVEATQGALLIGLGLAGGLGQYLLFEAFRHAPASTVAPVEYSGLVWAFALGYWVWGDVPAFHVFAGAALIVASSLALIASERKRRRAGEQA